MQRDTGLVCIVLWCRCVICRLEVASRSCYLSEVRNLSPHWGGIVRPKAAKTSCRNPCSRVKTSSGHSLACHALSPNHLHPHPPFLCHQAANLSCAVKFFFVTSNLHCWGNLTLNFKRQAFPNQNSLCETHKLICFVNAANCTVACVFAAIRLKRHKDDGQGWANWWKKQRCNKCSTLCFLGSSHWTLRGMHWKARTGRNEETWKWRVSEEENEGHREVNAVDLTLWRVWLVWHMVCKMFTCHQETLGALQTRSQFEFICLLIRSRPCSVSVMSLL